MGFRLAYVKLLEAIADHDHRTLNQMCEHTLSKSFNDGLVELGYPQIEVLNVTERSIDDIKITVVDEGFYFGASIDRYTNRSRGLLLYKQR